MPLGNARGLDDQTYIDIVAYILQFNGIPAGAQKLEPDVRVLEQIVVAIPLRWRVVARPDARLDVMSFKHGRVLSAGVPHTPVGMIRLPVFL